MMPKKSKAEVAEDKTGDAVGDKAVEAALASLRKKHGDEVVSWMDKAVQSTREVISTGSMRLDAALGVGGIVLGRMYEFFGPNMSGKSTLALSVIREAIKAGRRVIYVDAEHALDDSDDGLLAKMGIDVSKIALARGYTAEQSMDIAEALMATGEFDVCVFDSVSALQPMAEANLQSFEENTMGVHPRLMARLCRTFIPLAARTKTALILINQIRANIGGYGNPETTAGGNAIPHFASVRIRISGGGVKGRLIKNDAGVAIGQRSSFEVVKNKLAAPFKHVEVDLIFGKGFDTDSEVFDLALEMGFIDQAGAWFSMEGNKIGQGRVNAMDFLRQNKDQKNELVNKINKMLVNE